MYFIFLSIYVTSTIFQLLDNKIVILIAQCVKMIILWLVWNELQLISYLWLPIIFEMHYIHSKHFSQIEIFGCLNIIQIIFSFQINKQIQFYSVLPTFANIGLFVFWYKYARKTSISEQQQQSLYHSQWLNGENALIVNENFQILFDFRLNSSASNIISIEMQQYLKTIMKTSIGSFQDWNIVKDKNLYIIYKSKGYQEHSSQNNTQFDDFSKSISHELSTCLNGLLTLSYLAVTDQSMSIATKEMYLEPMLQNSQQLELIVSNLKDYNDIKGKSFMSEIGKFDIIGEAKKVIAFFEMALIAKQIQIRMHSTIADPQIFNDKRRYKQVLYQLLQNSERYSKSGTIILKFKLDENSIKITIEDQGIGMNIEESTKLQDIINFNRLQRVSKYSVGCGLGVCISNIILNELSQPKSRSLQFRTEQNIGTTFKFWITHNYQEDNESQMLHTIKSQSQKEIKVLYNAYSYRDLQFQSILSNRPNDSLKVFQKNKSRFRSVNNIQSRNVEANTELIYDNIDYSGEFVHGQIPPVFISMKEVIHIQNRCCSKILIVDDECFNIYVMEKILSSITSISDKAFNGEEVIQKITSKEICEVCGNKYYQLIMLDVNMPIKDGIETVKEIKDLYNLQLITKVICIANSAFSDLTTKQACFDAGVDYYITKPIDVAFFRDLIATLFKI